MADKTDQLERRINLLESELRALRDVVERGVGAMADRLDNTLARTLHERPDACIEQAHRHQTGAAKSAARAKADRELVQALTRTAPSSANDGDVRPKCGGGGGIKNNCPTCSGSGWVATA